MLKVPIQTHMSQSIAKKRGVSNMDVYSLTVVMGLTTHHYVMGEWTPFLVRRQWNAHSQDHVKPM